MRFKRRRQSWKSSRRRQHSTRIKKYGASRGGIRM